MKENYKNTTGPKRAGGGGGSQAHFFATQPKSSDRPPPARWSLMTSPRGDKYNHIIMKILFLLPAGDKIVKPVKKRLLLS